jgi:hypothetical protein
MIKNEKFEIHQLKKDEFITNKRSKLLEDWNRSVIDTGRAHRSAVEFQNEKLVDHRIQIRNAKKQEEIIHARYQEALNVRNLEMAKEEEKLKSKQSFALVRQEYAWHDREEANSIAMMNEAVQKSREDKINKNKSKEKVFSVIQQTATQVDFDITKRVEQVKLETRVIRHARSPTVDKNVILNEVSTVKNNSIIALRREVIKELQSRWKQERHVIIAKKKISEKSKIDTFGLALSALDRLDRSPDRWGRIKNANDVHNLEKLILEVANNDKLSKEFDKLMHSNIDVGVTLNDAIIQSSNSSTSDHSSFDGFKCQKIKSNVQDALSHQQEDTSSQMDDSSDSQDNILPYYSEDISHAIQHDVMVKPWKRVMKPTKKKKNPEIVVLSAAHNNQSKLNVTRDSVSAWFIPEAIEYTHDEMNSSQDERLSMMFSTRAGEHSFEELKNMKEQPYLLGGDEDIIQDTVTDTKSELWYERDQVGNLNSSHQSAVSVATNYSGEYMVMSSIVQSPQLKPPTPPSHIVKEAHRDIPFPPAAPRPFVTRPAVHVRSPVRTNELNIPNHVQSDLDPSAKSIEELSEESIQIQIRDSSDDSLRFET